VVLWKIFQLLEVSIMIFSPEIKLNQKCHYW